MVKATAGDYCEAARHFRRLVGLMCWFMRRRRLETRIDTEEFLREDAVMSLRNCEWCDLDGYWLAAPNIVAGRKEFIQERLEEPEPGLDAEERAASDFLLKHLAECMPHRFSVCVPAGSRRRPAWRRDAGVADAGPPPCA